MAERGGGGRDRLARPSRARDLVCCSRLSPKAREGDTGDLVAAVGNCPHPSGPGGNVGAASLNSVTREGPSSPAVGL